MFINDLLDNRDDMPKISFANDTSVIINHENLEMSSKMASNAGSHIFKGLSDNELVLNTAKTRCLLFGRGDASISFNVHHPTCSYLQHSHCDGIISCRTHKFLGLVG